MLSINTTTSAVTVIGSLGIDIDHNGMGVEFNANELYGLSGNNLDMLFKVSKTLTPVFFDDFSTNTTGNYTWVRNENPDYWPGTGYAYVSTGNNSGYVFMDGIYNGNLCCWIPANINAEKDMPIPSSGQATIDFEIKTNGEGQSRMYLRLKQDDNNYYTFIVTDNTYGSSGYTQGVRKIINGTTVNSILAAGTVITPGKYNLVAYWSPTNLRLRITNLTTGIKTEHNLNTSNTTVLNPTKFVFGAYRFEANWYSVKVSPGLATNVGPLGVSGVGVGVEFNPQDQNEVFAIRNNNVLYKYTLDIGSLSTGILITGISTVNLAAPWPTAP